MSGTQLVLILLALGEVFLAISLLALARALYVGAKR